MSRTQQNVVFRLAGRQYCVELCNEVSENLPSGGQHKDYLVRQKRVVAENKSAVAQGNDEALPSRRASDLSDTSRIISPMFGTVTEVIACVGQHVQHGDLLLRIEAMKMENNISSSCSGTITAVHVAAGAEVREAQLLIEIKPSKA